jgi:hypothetical protein
MKRLIIKQILILNLIFFFLPIATQVDSYQANYIGCGIEQELLDMSHNFISSNTSMTLDLCAINCLQYDYFGTQSGYKIY